MASIDIACKYHRSKYYQNLLIYLFKALRIKYKEKRDVFREDSIEVKEPINLFGKWFDEACKTEEIIEPNAMCLATVSP